MSNKPPVSKRIKEICKGIIKSERISSRATWVTLSKINKTFSKLDLVSDDWMIYNKNLSKLTDDIEVYLRRVRKSRKPPRKKTVSKHDQQKDDILW